MQRLAYSLGSYLAIAAILAGCASDDGNKGTTDTSQVTDSSPLADTTTVADTAGDTTTEQTPCDDGDPCTVGDVIDDQGICKGTAKDCSDALACTIDTCGADGTCANTLSAGFCVTDGLVPSCVSNASADPANGCRVCDATTGPAPLFVTLDDNASCDDGDACTTGDTCASGQCVTTGALDCDTGDPCLAGACDAALGCVETPTTAACDDADPCTVGDTCSEGKCVAGAGEFDCADTDPCTVDSCVAGEGCLHDATALCDDNDPCTNDSCAVGNCTNLAFTGPCDDGNPCTTGETCNGAGTCGSGSATDCNDDEACTLDSCHPDRGCLHIFVDDDCDDGDECTLGDVCVAGACFGAKTDSCDYCPLDPTDHANKVVTLELMSDGNPGSGLDLDDDPTTCAPSSSCGGGVDNALAVIAFIMNPSVSDSIKDGVVKWIVDLRHARFDGEPFVMPVYDSGLSVASEIAGCDFQMESCEYETAQLSFDQNCNPYFAFKNAVIKDGKLTAGGDGNLINLVLPLANGNLLAVTIASARVDATYTTNEAGKIDSMAAVIAGAVPKQQLKDAINGLDQSALDINKDTALELLDRIVINDIDLDGDGLKEAASVGMRISTIPATIAR